MPDHVHLFVSGDPEFRLSDWVRLLKQALTRALPEGRPPGRVWQEGFFDHALRSDESLAQKWNYVRENPVRAGLVADAEAWPFAGEIVVIDRA